MYKLRLHKKSQFHTGLTTDYSFAVPLKNIYQTLIEKTFEKIDVFNQTDYGCTNIILTINKNYLCQNTL